MGMENMKKLLKKAEIGKYAVGAFTTFNMEYTRAILEVAEELRSPVIIMIGTVEAEYAGMERLSSLIQHEVEKYSIPVALHFDHGNTFEIVMQAIRCGFTSVMFDGSLLPYEDNVAVTRDIVCIAHAVGVDVEGEIGLIGGQEGEIQSTVDLGSHLTDPEEARDFAQKTGVDALAVAIGTSHGIYRTQPNIDIERLKAIRNILPIPLVLHGGSDTPEEKIRESIKNGIVKININSDLKAAFTKGLREYLSHNPEDISFEKAISHSLIQMKNILRHKFHLLGSAGKA